MQLLRKSLVAVFVTEDLISYTELIVMSISSSIVQPVVFQLSSLFHHLQYKPLLSTEDFIDMLKPEFETCLTANSKMNWIALMAVLRCIKEISPAAQNKEFFEVSSLLFLLGPLVAERSQQGCFYRVKQCE